MRFLTLTVIAGIFPLVALAEPNPALVGARAKVDDLDYAAAIKLLDAALEVPGNEREALLEIYELQGVSWATLGKVDKARLAFRALVVLDPEHSLGGAQPPRVKTPFYEAKEWAAKAGVLKVEPALEKKGDEIVGLTVTVPPDALGMARAVMVHVDVGGAVRDAEAALTPASRSVAIAVGAKGFGWWAEVKGDRGATLLRSGTSAAPNVVAAPRAPDVPVVAKLTPGVNGSVAPAGSGQRVAGVLVGIAGVGALALGAAFGAISVDARSQITHATRDVDGNVTGLTQRRASELDAQARDLGAAANVLMIGGGVVTAVGLALVIFAPTDSVVIAPAPGGATVSGRF